MKVGLAECCSVGCAHEPKIGVDREGIVVNIGLLNGNGTYKSAHTYRRHVHIMRCGYRHKSPPITFIKVLVTSCAGFPQIHRTPQQNSPLKADTDETATYANSTARAERHDNNMVPLLIEQRMRNEEQTRGLIFGRFELQTGQRRVQHVSGVQKYLSLFCLSFKMSSKLRPSLTAPC